jgi:hypothetical protein
MLLLISNLSKDLTGAFQDQKTYQQRLLKSLKDENKNVKQQSVRAILKNLI